MPDNLRKVNEMKMQDKKAKLVIFDLDGTLTASKTNLDEEMAELLVKLLEQKKVAVISGGRFEQFKKQFLSVIDKTVQGRSGYSFCELARQKLCTPKAPRDLFANLFLFPTSGATFYRYGENGWAKVYSEVLTEDEKQRTMDAFAKTFQELNYTHPEKIYGELIEDRGTQVTFSALGQEAPLEEKLKWKAEHTEDKLKIVERMQNYLPDLEVRAGGYTSVDVTHKGIDKEYGIKQIKKHLGVDFGEMLFVGDALFPGGNDSAALRTGVPCFEVSGPEETKVLIRSLLSANY